MRKRDNHLMVGLDIGTTKICTLVGESKEDGIEIVGIGRYPSRGLRKGVVVDMESTIQSIKKAVEEAELMAGCSVASVYVGIAGGHIKGFNSTGIVKIRDGEVKEADVRRVIETATAVDIPPDREVLHVVPQEYTIDGQDGIKEPVGLVGVRLEAQVHIVTGAVTSAQNLIKCANSAGLNVNDIVLEQLASSEAVLTEDEKELGVALVDIGGGTSDLAIFSGGSVKHTSVLGLGGNQITSDLAVGLQTPISDAEEVKKQWGCCRSSLIDPEELIEVQGVGGRGVRSLSRSVLAEIIEPRVSEVFTLIKREIEMSGYQEMIPSGLVLTGGSAQLAGVVDLAEEIFQAPVRVGVPNGVGGLVEVIRNPSYATAVGLLLYGKRDRDEKRFPQRGEKTFSKVIRRMRAWFEGLFL
ncbi:MAG: cell division protein FtsA [bacterium]